MMPGDKPAVDVLGVDAGAGVGAGAGTGAGVGALSCRTDGMLLITAGVLRFVVKNCIGGGGDATVFDPADCPGWLASLVLIVSVDMVGACLGEGGYAAGRGGYVDGGEGKKGG